MVVKKGVNGTLIISPFSLIYAVDPRLAKFQLVLSTVSKNIVCEFNKDNGVKPSP